VVATGRRPAAPAGMTAASPIAAQANSAASGPARRGDREWGWEAGKTANRRSWVATRRRGRELRLDVHRPAGAPAQADRR